MRALVREIKSRYHAVDGLFKDHDPGILEAALQEPGSIDTLVEGSDQDLAEPITVEAIS